MGTEKLEKTVSDGAASSQGVCGRGPDSSTHTSAAELGKPETFFSPSTIPFLINIALENFSASVTTVPMENVFLCCRAYKLEHNCNPGMEKGNHPLKKSHTQPYN